MTVEVIISGDGHSRAAPTGLAFTPAPAGRQLPEYAAPAPVPDEVKGPLPPSIEGRGPFTPDARAH